MPAPVLTDAPLKDSDGDGRIVLSTARYGLPKGAVLLPDGRQGAQYRYRVEGALREAPVPTPPTPTAAAMESHPATANSAAIRIKVDTPGLVIRDRWIDGSYRAIETDAGADTPDALIERVKITNAWRDGIRLRNADRAVIQDFEIRHGPHENTGTDLPEGIAILRGHGILIRRGVVSGFRGKAPNGYSNGDPIATERDTSGRIEDVLALDGSDGGFDIKGKWWLDRCRAEGNGKGFRFWHEIEAGTLYTNSTIHICPGAKVRIGKVVAYGAKPFALFTTEGGGATVTLDAWDVTGMAPGWTKVKHNEPGTTFAFGPGCVMP